MRSTLRDARRELVQPGAVSVFGVEIAPPPPTRGLRRQDADVSEVPLSSVSGSGGGGGEGGSGSAAEMTVFETRVSATLVEAREDRPRADASGRERGPGRASVIDYAHAIAVPMPPPSGNGGSEDDFLDDSGAPRSEGANGAANGRSGGKSNRLSGSGSLMEAVLQDRRACVTVVCLILAAAAASGIAIGLLSKRTSEATVPLESTEEWQEQSLTSTTPPPPPPAQAVDLGNDPHDSRDTSSDDWDSASSEIKEAEDEDEDEDIERLIAIRDGILPLYQRYLPDHPSLPHELYNASSPQYAALRWLAHDDPARLDPSFRTGLKRRYVPALLFFATGGRLPDDDDDEHDAADGPFGSWKQRFHFVSGGNECDWNGDTGSVSWDGTAISKGVECDELWSITSISLVENGLSGTIPPELASLPRLESLKLRDNPNLTGSVEFLCRRITSKEHQANNDLGTLVDADCEEGRVECSCCPGCG